MTKKGGKNASKKQPARGPQKKSDSNGRVPAVIASFVDPCGAAPTHIPDDAVAPSCKLGSKTFTIGALTDQASTPGTLHGALVGYVPTVQNHVFSMGFNSSMWPNEQGGYGWVGDAATGTTTNGTNTMMSVANLHAMCPAPVGTRDSGGEAWPMTAVRVRSTGMCVKVVVDTQQRLRSGKLHVGYLRFNHDSASTQNANWFIPQCMDSSRSGVYDRRTPSVAQLKHECVDLQTFSLCDQLEFEFVYRPNRVPKYHAPFRETAIAGTHNPSTGEDMQRSGYNLDAMVIFVESVQSENAAASVGTITTECSANWEIIPADPMRMAVQPSASPFDAAAYEALVNLLSRMETSVPPHAARQHVQEGTSWYSTTRKAMLEFLKEYQPAVANTLMNAVWFQGQRLGLLPTLRQGRLEL